LDIFIKKIKKQHNTLTISIITITYNAEQFLEKTILSVLHQSNHDFDYWIIDGNSKDRTKQIITEFSQRIQSGEFPGVDGNQFHWISEPDRGLYDAMNKGIVKATGDFVWFMNAGDQIYDTETLQKVQDLLEIEPECDFIYGQSIMIDEDGKELGERHKIAPSVLQSKHFLKGLIVCHQSVIVRRDIAPKYNLHYSIASDYDWMIRTYKNANCRGYIDQYLSRFLIAGVSSQKRKLAWAERFFIMKSHFGIIRTLYAHFLIILRYPFSKKY